MKKFTWYDGAALMVWLVPVVYFISVYPNLPAKMPMHFGIDGKPDRYGDRQEMLVIELFILGLTAGLYLLIKYLPSIDPKQQAKHGVKMYQKLALGIVVFMAAISIIIPYAGIHNGLKIDKLILPLVSLLFAFLGNVMYSVKPNYFVGIRTPWTLESEETWRATHQLAGKLWFIGGLVLAVLALLLGSNAAFIVFMTGVAVLVLVPTIYSYKHFKSHQVKL